MGHIVYYVVGPETELISIWKTIKKVVKEMKKEIGFSYFDVASDMLTFRQNMPLRYECFDKNGDVIKENLPKGTVGIVTEGDRVPLSRFLQSILHQEHVSEDVYITEMSGINYQLYLDEFHAFREKHPDGTFENKYIHIEPRLFRAI